MRASTRVLSTAAASTALLAAGLLTAGAASAGVSGPAFYIDGVVYRTVATPTDLSTTGAPAQSFDTIYSFSGAQMSVATAAPGDRDFNGGRWMVHALAFPDGYAAALASGDTNGNGVIDSDAELWVAINAGTAVDTGVVKAFVCTVNKVPASQR
ncbi:MAG TPA: hypothetical protein VGK35_11975 [Actinotalea sp.]